MIQCKDCDLCEMTPEGKRLFKCDPFTNIKEPECLQKWQLLRLDMLASSYASMLQWYEKMAPLQSKILKIVQREMDDIDEADKWKLPDEDNPDDPFTQ